MEAWQRARGHLDTKHDEAIGMYHNQQSVFFFFQVRCASVFQPIDWTTRSAVPVQLLRANCEQWSTTLPIGGYVALQQPRKFRLFVIARVQVGEVFRDEAKQAHYLIGWVDWGLIFQLPRMLALLPGSWSACSACREFVVTLSSGITSS